MVRSFVPMPGAGPRTPQACVVSAFLIDMDPSSAGHGRLLENHDGRSVDET
jgi:hypothetical protein